MDNVTEEGLPIIKAPTSTTEEGLPILSKKATPPVGGSTLPQSITGLNSFPSSHPSIPNSPVTDPHLQQQIKDNQEADRQATVQQLKNVSDKLNKVRSGLTPEQQKNWDMLAQNMPNQQGRDKVTTEDPENQRQYEMLKTPLGKVAGSVLYLASKATHGGLDIAKGAAHLAQLGANPLSMVTGEDATKPLFDKADKLADFGLTNTAKTTMEGSGYGKPLSALGMAAEFAPAVAGGEAANAPKAMMYLQGLGQGKDMADNIEKGGAQLNPVAKEALVQGSGLVNLLLTDVFKGAKLSPQVSSKIVTGIAADALKDAAGKDISEGAFKDILAGKAQTFAQKFEKAPIDAISHYNETAKTFMKLNAANFGLHKAVDELNDKPVFNETVGDLAGSTSKALMQDAPIFSALPAVGELTKLFPNSNYKNNVAESLMTNPSDENINTIKQQLSDHGQQQGWTPEETDATLKHVDAIGNAAKTLPRDIAPDKKEDAVDLVMNRNDLQERLAKVQEQKQTLDPALQDIPNPQETYLTDKIEQANDKIKDIVTKSKTTYSKGVGDEEGQFFKTTNGAKEEIEPSRYELENTEREAKKQLPAEDNSQNTITNNQENGKENIPTEEKVNQEKTGTTDEENLADKKEHVRERVPDAEAPTLPDLSRNLKETGKSGISIEPSFKRTYGTNELSDEEQDNGMKYVVSRDKEGKVNGALEISYNGKDGESDKPVSVKVAVDPEQQRQGIATALFKHAQDNGIDLSDVRGKVTTDAGKALFEANKSKQKAIDYITHGLIVPEGVKDSELSARLDLEMSTAEKRKALNDITKGNYDTAPAKKLIAKVQDFEKNGAYPVIEGTGGTVRRSAITSDEMAQHFEDAKANKIGELSQKQIDEFNKHAQDIGITAEDVKAYEERNNTTHGSGDNTGASESPAEPVSEPKNDETASSPQSSGSEAVQGEKPKKFSIKKENTNTGIRNEDVSTERGEAVGRTKKSREQTDAEGRRLVDSKELDPDQFAKDIIDNPYPASTEEQAALRYHKVNLEREQRQLAKDPTPDNEVQYTLNEQRLEINRKATEIIGNEAARTVGDRAGQIAEDYSRIHVLERAKVANGGVLDPKDEKELTARTKRIEELENKLADREEEIRKLHERGVVDKVKRAAELEERTAKRQVTKQSLRKEREDIKAELFTIARKSRSNIGANKIPVEMLAPLAKLARNYVLDGAVSVAQVADKIYNDLKDHLDGVDKEDIENVIKDNFDKYLHEQNQVRLERSKKLQSKKLEDLKEGNYEKKVYSKIQVDNDYLAIRAEIKREQTLVNKKIDDIQNSQKSVGRKAVDFAVKWGRWGKLASVTVLGKLAATGLTTLALKPITELVGAGYSKLLPKIAEKAIYEGGIHTKGFVKDGQLEGLGRSFAKAAFLSMQDAGKELNIKKGGQSDLSALYGKYVATRLPAEAADFFGHLHSAIKAPVKRTIWEYSYAKRFEKTAQAGLDPLDPVTDAKNRLDAYKDAERAIFMGDNKLSSAYEAAMKTLENSDSGGAKNIAALTRIILPFVKVPTNIVLSAGRYSFGLVPGLGRLAQVGTSAGLKMAGAEGLAKIIHTNMGELTPEESEQVLRNLKHGSVGGAALLLGFYNPKNFGGFYQPGEKRKKNDAEVGGIKIGNTNVYKMLTEHPIFLTMQIGATFRRVLDAHKHKDDNISAATLATASGLSESVPLANGAKQILDALSGSKKFAKFSSSLIKGEIEPALIQQLAQATDTKDGSPISLNPKNQVKRQPNNKHGVGRYIKEDLETGFPGLRKNVRRKP